MDLVVADQRANRGRQRSGIGAGLNVRGEVTSPTFVIVVVRMAVRARRRPIVSGVSSLAAGQSDAAANVRGLPTLFIGDQRVEGASLTTEEIVALSRDFLGRVHA